MLSASHLLHDAAGRPSCGREPLPVDGPCALCGAPVSEGIRCADAFGSSFAGHDHLRAPDSLHICVPCAWTLTGKAYGLGLLAVEEGSGE